MSTEQAPGNTPKAAPANSNAQPSHSGHSANNNAQKISAEIKKHWGKLTDEEIGFLAGRQDKFYEAVKTKYSIDKNEAEKTVKKLEAECAAPGSHASGKPSDAASGPVAKAS